MHSARARRRREGGQSLVEFSLILAPLLFILLGIIQFGFIFNSVVTLSTAAREGARDGSVYVYDRIISKQANDTARNNKAKTTLLVSMNNLTKRRITVWEHPDIVLNVDIDEEFLSQRSLTDFAFRERHMQTYRKYLAEGNGGTQQASAKP